MLKKAERATLAGYRNNKHKNPHNMKQILFLFLLLASLNATAQIDINRFTLTTDTTISSVDTVYWNFAMIEYQRGQKTIPLYQADLVTWRSGNRTVQLSSGVLIRRDYAEYLRQQRDRLAAERLTLLAAVKQLADQQAAISQELISLQNR